MTEPLTQVERDRLFNLIGVAARNPPPFIVELVLDGSAEAHLYLRTPKNGMRLSLLEEELVVEALRPIMDFLVLGKPAEWVAAHIGEISGAVRRTLPSCEALTLNFVRWPRRDW